MTLSRKSFLRHAALGPLGLAAAARGGAATAPAGSPTNEIVLPEFSAANAEAFWAAVRDQYPLTRGLAYFNTGGLGPSCRAALAAAEQTTRKLQERAEHGHGLFAGARASAARFLGAEPAEVAFVRNATEGNAIVAGGLALRAGDEVIIDAHAHPGGSFAWLQQRATRGVVVRVFEPDAQDAEGNVERIRKLMTPRTRVVQISHVTAPTGILLPAARIAALCRERGVWFHIDAAQSVGQLHVDVRQLGGDSLATSGHKWLGGPLETGLLWVQRARIAEVLPPLVGAYSGDLPGGASGRAGGLAEAAAGAGLKLADNAERFEFGTRNPAAAVGLAAAMGFQEQIGRERLERRGRDLATRLHGRLAAVRGVAVLTPAEPGLRAAMVTFRCARMPHDQLFARLLREHAMRCRPVTEEGLNALRVSTHGFNSEAECDALAAAVAKIAGGAA